MGGVKMHSSVSYKRIDDAGLHLEIEGEAVTLEVDNVVICAGQESLCDLYEPLQQEGVTVHLIGGADEARQLDAKRAIRQGTTVALGL